MARGAVLSAILEDPALQALGFSSDNVKTNYAAEQRPGTAMFMNLTWGQQRIQSGFNRGPRDLTIWVHMYKAFSTDYCRIDEVIEELDRVLGNIIDMPGDDGYTVTSVYIGDKSRDMQDRGYDTLCRSTSYAVLSRKT